MASELSKKTVMAWRAFVQTPEFAAGLTHLKELRTPSVRGKTAVELLEAAGKWGAYFEALDDLTDVIAHVPTADKSAEDSGLET